jgi:hypoxanthine-guanine phosphoribosyltransferase
VKEKKILHITDLHINNFSTGSDEHLGDGLFHSYIDEMCKKVKEKYTTVDAIIISGDFVDVGKTDNFSHAAKIIQRIHTNLETNNSKVGVCIGNHDIKCTFNETGADKIIMTEDRTAYKTFSDEYSNGIGNVFFNDRFSISKIGTDILFLSIDSTLNRDGKNLLVSELKKAKTTDTQLLIISTHYPCVHFYHYPFPVDKGWHDEHFWNTGEHLRNRINKEISDIKVLWLFGDTHQPAQMQMSTNIYVMSGRFGTTTKSVTPSVIPRHAQIIHYKHNNEADIAILNHQPSVHTDESQDGVWKFSESDSHKLPMFQPELIFDGDSETHEFEKTIIQNIVSRDLYSFGRFVINQDEVSLGWVSINQLLNQRDILAPLIKYSKEWILQKRIYTDKLLIIGVNFWGAIIASNLSTMLGCKNICCASRGDSQHHTINLLLTNEKCCELLKATDSILIISDVVASGRTIHKIHSLFQKNCSGTPMPKFSSISVISDIRQEKKMNLNFLESFGTFCGNLRIPIFKEVDLPPGDVMPAKPYMQ